MEELKNALNNLPGGASTPASYTANVQKNLQRIEKRVKVLGYPEEAMRDAYASLVDDQTDEELTLLLTLRGVIKPQSNFQQNLTSFINSL